MDSRFSAVHRWRGLSVPFPPLGRPSRQAANPHPPNSQRRYGPSPHDGLPLAS